MASTIHEFANRPDGVYFDCTHLDCSGCGEEEWFKWFEKGLFNAGYRYLEEQSHIEMLAYWAINEQDRILYD